MLAAVLVGLLGPISPLRAAPGDWTMTKTAITKNSKAAPVADLKAGTRVVVEIEEGDKDRVAHTVKLGAAGGK